MTAISERAVAGVRAAARVKVREQVQVAVLFGGRQTDMVLPATEPVATIIPAVFDELRPDEPLRDPDAKDMVTPGTVVFKRVGGRSLSRDQSLRDQGIRDGALLILDIDDAKVPFTPVRENASSEIAHYNASHFPGVTVRTAVWFAAVAATLGTVVAVGLLLNVWRLDLAAGKSWPVPALLPTAVLAGSGVALLLGGAVVWWRRRMAVVANGLWIGGVIATTAGAFAAPPGMPSSWHVVFAVAIAGVLAVLLWRLSPAPRGVLAWLTLVSIGVFAAALVHGMGVNLTYISIGGLVVALIVLKSTETLAQILAAVPMPPFPTVTGKLAFDDAEEIAAEALVAAETEGTPSVSQLQRAAAAANTYQRAIVAAVAPFFVAGAVGAVTPGQGRWWLGTVFVLMLAAILVFRGRSFADRMAAVTVVATAFVMSTALGLKYALLSNDPRMSLLIAGLIVALGVSALVAAAVVPQRPFSAPFRKGVEWLDYGLQVLIPPITFWLLNLYYLVRNSL
ncbi:type VII secretion integral membrane protein EccD [Mycolicibacter sinensis]|uniref:Type VII secretion integral membrane protein EccD n=1 Tax=Mycolicibacter sinensis (strain JDM601) TaxID=875328 RepID=A0A1A2XGJ0_MYCSD|nr:type VII secretion integral membrane protein EccD [Mycolicibacter sinensis]OBI24303.1 type VII secretion integral membrane protein EccD [Mycolicibacter sinensis]